MKTTNVKFYRETNGQVLAFFPNLEDHDGFYNCYTHVGQHSLCLDTYAQSLKPATRLEFEPLLDELESIGYDNLQIVLPTKKWFREETDYHNYTGYNAGRRTSVHVYYYDWERKPEVPGARTGWKFGIKANARALNKAELLNGFYEYLFETGVRPEWTTLREAADDTERFKTPITLNW